MSSLIKRDLFGGAITAETAERLVDASDFRQVPDTQEVLLYPSSSISIIVEILQKVEVSQLKDAIKFHFDSLAHDNDAQSATVHLVSEIRNDRQDKTPSATVLSGEQLVPKFNRPGPDRVKIFMALFRVATKGIDIVVTFNVPVVSADGGAVGPEGLTQAETDFDALVRSFRIVNDSLFA